MSEQLTLGISLRDDATFDNYFPASNKQIIYELKSQQQPYLFLFGGAGTGKSHLLQAACHLADEKGQLVAYLPLQESGLKPEMLDGLEVMELIALDDIHCVCSDDKWELALFNFYNRIRENGKKLIVSSAQPVSALNIKLADLSSRLSSGAAFQLTALNDHEKQQALQQRAKRRGLELENEVVAYLLKRSPRGMNSLFDLFDKLDQASMREKRKLTIPFIKNYL